MGRRRRVLAYFAILILWAAGTYYFASTRLSQTTRMHSVNERTFQLKSRLEEVEESIRRQEQENKKLLAFLRNQFSRPVIIGKNGVPAGKEIAKFGNPKKMDELSGDGKKAEFRIQGLDAAVAILVFACNRPAAIKNHLDQLLKLRPSKELFPIIVSQDCSHPETTEAIRSYGDALTFLQQPDQTDLVKSLGLTAKQKKFLGYYKISRHYKWALNQTFFEFGYRTAIITEDDLDISVDFFEYFIATYPLLRLDPSLWCISAWNDNGKVDKIAKKPDLLYRTDFFPGLGWMVTRETWEELVPQWPTAFWDDWMRKPEQRKDRACIRPEMSRTAMSKHGKVGVSKGLFFEKHLKLIALNTEFVPFTHMNLSHLLKENYDQAFIKDVYSWPSITQSELHAGKLKSGDPLPKAVRLTYDNKNTYKTTAKAFGLMDDFRAGVPRTAYRGVVPFMFKDTRVYLAPFADWKAYDPSWT